MRRLEPALRSELEGVAGPSIRWDVPLSRHTSLRVGGPAEALVTPGDEATLLRVLDVCAERGVSVHCLGKGFNSLVRDGGIPGVTLSLTRLRDIQFGCDGVLRVEAGVSHHAVAKFCIEHGISGLEFCAGIPGTVGGWVAMNAGVPEAEIADVLLAVQVVPPGGARREIPRESLRFRYRALEDVAEGFVIVGASFAVHASTTGSVQEAVDEHLAHRARTQPIDRPSCGSVFKNPPGDFAGRLIEEAGLKGLSVGGASVSQRHANFIVTESGTRAADVLALIEKVQGAVHERSGVSLELEVRVLGTAE